jgi:hypothetical protein
MHLSLNQWWNHNPANQVAKYSQTWLNGHLLITAMLTSPWCNYSFFLSKFHPQKSWKTEIFNDNWTHFLFRYTLFLPEFKLYSCICPPHERVRSWCRLHTWTIVTRAAGMVFSYTSSLKPPYNGQLLISSLGR